MIQELSTPEFIAGIVSGDYNENDVIQRCRREPNLMALFKSLLRAASTIIEARGVQGRFMWCLSKRGFDFDNTKDLCLYTNVEFVRLQNAMAIVCDHLETPHTAFALTDTQQTAFQKAMKAKYMEQTEHGYKWLYGGKARLAYFIYRVFNPDGYARIPYLEAV